MRLILQAIGIIALLTNTTSSAQSPPDADSSKLYEVAMTLKLDGKIIGTPKVIVAPGASAIIEHAAVNDGYSLKTNIRTDGGIATSSINVQSEVYYSSGGKWVILTTPSIFTNLGKAASISGRSATGKGFELTYLVSETSRAKFGKIQSFGKNPCNEKKVTAWKAAMFKPVVFAPATPTALVAPAC